MATVVRVDHVTTCESQIDTWCRRVECRLTYEPTCFVLQLTCRVVNLRGIVRRDGIVVHQIAVAIGHWIKGFTRLVVRQSPSASGATVAPHNDAVGNGQTGPGAAVYRLLPAPVGLRIIKCPQRHRGSTSV